MTANRLNGDNTRMVEEIPPNKRRMWAFKVRQKDYEEIKRRAAALDMTMTEFVTRSALGTLDGSPAQDSRTEARFRELEERIKRIEALALGGTFD